MKKNKRKTRYEVRKSSEKSYETEWSNICKSSKQTNMAQMTENRVEESKTVKDR